MGREGLVGFRVAVKETDLMVLAPRDLSGEVREVIIQERQQLEAISAGSRSFSLPLTPGLLIPMPRPWCGI